MLILLMLVKSKAHWVVHQKKTFDVTNDSEWLSMIYAECMRLAETWTEVIE